MADCKKTVDFLREWQRMCNTHLSCEKCHMAQINIGESAYTCRGFILEKVDDAIAIVQKWSDEHPVMTWEGKLREMLPGAKEEALETIKHSFCQSDIFGFGGDGNCTKAEQSKACWNGEYKEVEK